MYLWRVTITRHHGYDGDTKRDVFVVAPDEEAAKKAAEEKAREPYDSITWDIERLDEVDGHTITVDAAQRVAALEADAAKMREALEAIKQAFGEGWVTIDSGPMREAVGAAIAMMDAALATDAGRAYAEEHERYREALVVIAEGPGARYPQSSVGQWAAEMADAALRGGGPK